MLLGADLDELTPEQRAELDRLDAERERSRELHERFGKKLDYIHKVRDGLLPPPWQSSSGKEQPKTHQQGPAVLRRITAKKWITAEAERLKRSGLIPADISKTDFAKCLATNMALAAERDHLILIRPVRWKYIRNHLSKWGLWPPGIIE